ncbi:MAG: type II toxin-antitoxin system death-on-curing family toxin [Candidatus Hodarchaeota archaeon]
MKEVWYPDFDDIMEVFRKLLDRFRDLRKENLMDERAIKSILDKVRYGLPFKSSDFWEKVAILWHDISYEHHFSNGNKRVGYFAMRLFLKKNGYKLKKISDEEKIDYCLEIAKGNMNYNAIVLWLKINSEKI